MISENNIMKTIDFETAQGIVFSLRLPKTTALSDFEVTGLIKGNNVDYHTEIDLLIAKPHMFLRSQRLDLERLKKYFNKYAPLPVMRDPANIKTLEFDCPVYEGKVEFRITWNEVIVTIKDEAGNDICYQSISLVDAKVLAQSILNN